MSFLLGLFQSILTFFFILFYFRGVQGSWVEGQLTYSESFVILLGCARCREQLGGSWWHWFLCMVYSSFTYAHRAQFNRQQFSILTLRE